MTWVLRAQDKTELARFKYESHARDCAELLSKYSPYAMQLTSPEGLVTLYYKGFAQPEKS